MTGVNAGLASLYCRVGFCGAGRTARTALAAATVRTTSAAAR